MGNTGQNFQMFSLAVRRLINESTTTMAGGAHACVLKSPNHLCHITGLAAFVYDHIRASNNKAILYWRVKAERAYAKVGSSLTFPSVVHAWLPVEVVRVLHVAVPVDPPPPRPLVALARVRQEGHPQRPHRHGQVLHACEHGE
eukprot:265336-Prorocentrum_minimum.AAC.15